MGLSWLKRPHPFWVFEFTASCAVPLPLRLLVTTFGIVVPIDLRPMAANGIPPGDVVIVLVFAAAAAAAAASMFVEGGVGIPNILGSLGESWVVINCANT